MVQTQVEGRPIRAHYISSLLHERSDSDQVDVSGVAGVDKHCIGPQVVMRL